MNFIFFAINIHALCKGNNIVVFWYALGVELEVIIANPLKGGISVKSR